MLKIVAKYAPPPAGVASPIYWGADAHLHDLFRGVHSIAITRKEFVFRYESPAHFVEVFRRFYGPTFKAFGALEPDGQRKLASELAGLGAKLSRRTDSFIVPAEYVEV